MQYCYLMVCDEQCKKYEKACPIKYQIICIITTQYILHVSTLKLIQIQIHDKDVQISTCGCLLPSINFYRYASDCFLRFTRGRTSSKCLAGPTQTTSNTISFEPDDEARQTFGRVGLWWHLHLVWIRFRHRNGTVPVFHTDPTSDPKIEDRVGANHRRSSIDYQNVFSRGMVCKKLPNIAIATNEEHIWTYMERSSFVSINVYNSQFYKSSHKCAIDFNFGLSEH